MLNEFGYCGYSIKNNNNQKEEIISIENIQFIDTKIPEEIPEFLLDSINYIEKYGILILFKY
jgi:hypothetical protein